MHEQVNKWFVTHPHSLNHTHGGTYPVKVFHIIDGGITDTPTLIEVVEGRGVTEHELLPLARSGTCQHGIEDVKVPLPGILTHYTVLLKQIFVRIESQGATHAVHVHVVYFIKYYMQIIDHGYSQ